MTHNSPNLVSLRDFLNGSLYRNGLLIFEDAMNCFVTSKMQEYFPTIHPDDEYKVYQRDLSMRRDALEKEIREVEADLEKARGAVEKDKEENEKGSSPNSRKTLGSTKFKFGKLRKELEVLGKKQKEMCNEPNRPHERWVRECKKVFPNEKMGKFVTADAHLDLYSITAIMLHHLKGVFAPNLKKRKCLRAKRCCRS